MKRKSAVAALILVILVCALALTACQKKESLHIELNGGTGAESEYTYKNGSSISLPTPAKQGVTFGGWYYDNDVWETPYDESIPIAGATVYARWLLPKLSMSDVYLPAALHSDDFGLFWYKKTESGTVSVRYDSPDVSFDPLKPVFIYIHGMGSGAGFPNPGDYVDDYNVGCFLWGPFASGDPLSGQSNVWGTTKMKWKNGSRLTKDDIPSHSLAEVFVAMYNDFMTASHFEGSEIRFAGHSLGAQFCMALGSYMTTGLKSGAFDITYMPDRITLLDMFLSNAADTTYCNWLNKELGLGGSTKAARDSISALNKIGVAVDYFMTSPAVHAMAKAMATFMDLDAPDDTYSIELDNMLMFVEISSEWLADSSMIEFFEGKHVYAIEWFEDMTNKNLPYDFTSESFSAYAASPHLPASYVYARMGVNYKMALNYTENDVSDDKQYSQNIQSAQIAGFAFNDQNGNGKHDERLKSRLEGIAVKLVSIENGYERAVAETITGKNGFYRFDITDISKTYKIKITLPAGYTITVLPESGSLMENNISASLETAPITLSDDIDLQIINVGLRSCLI